MHKRGLRVLDNTEMAREAFPVYCGPAFCEGEDHEPRKPIPSAPVPLPSPLPSYSSPRGQSVPEKKTSLTGPRRRFSPYYYAAPQFARVLALCN